MHHFYICLSDPASVWFLAVRVFAPSGDFWFFFYFCRCRIVYLHHLSVHVAQVYRETLKRIIFVISYVRRDHM